MPEKDNVAGPDAPEGEKVEIRGAVGWYRMLHGPFLPDEQALLSRFENDPRTAEMWRLFDRHATNPNDWARLIFAILEAWRARAIAAEDVVGPEQCLTLAGAAERLAAVFETISPAAPRAIAIAREFADRAAAAADSFRWAAALLREMGEGGAAARELLPKSQKRAPHLAFSLHLARSLADMTGRPLFDLVAFCATVAFPPLEIEPEAVRKAYARERRRR